MKYIVESNLPWRVIHALIHGADKGPNVTVLETKNALFMVDTPNFTTRVFYAAEHGTDEFNHLHEMNEVSVIDFSAVEAGECPSCGRDLPAQEQYDVCHCGECGFTWDMKSMYYTKVTKTIW